jgi:cyclohexyl-isocyanide hydratase
MGDQDFRIGLLLFPGVTQLDLTGPYEVLTRMPGAVVHVAAKTVGPVRSGAGLALLPTTTFADCPRLDLLCVPGGPGVADVLVDRETLDFVRRSAAGARYVTSVCTGSLILGAAGLLDGRRATTHWTSLELLRPFGALPQAERVVVDGNVITGGGVTAGIDFSLHVVAEVAGRAAAEAIQLGVEYDPEPPFACGSPRSASPELVARVTAAVAARQNLYAERVAEAAAALATPRS